MFKSLVDILITLYSYSSPKFTISPTFMPVAEVTETTVSPTVVLASATVVLAVSSKAVADGHD